jgi:hypothetical protein
MGQSAETSTMRFSASARRRLADLPAELDGQRVSQRRFADELQDHPRRSPEGHQTLIHPALGIERGQLPELTGQKLG